MKSSISIHSDNEYVELMYFSEDILVVISIIFNMDLRHCISDYFNLVVLMGQYQNTHTFLLLCN